MSWIWAHGRFGWPLIALALYTTVLVLAFDYAWRLIKAPFWQFIAAAAIAWAVGVAVIVVCGRRYRASRE